MTKIRSIIKEEEIENSQLAFLNTSMTDVRIIQVYWAVF